MLTLIVTPAALMGIANLAARRDRWLERRAANTAAKTAAKAGAAE